MATMTDEFSEAYGDLLDDVYDCVDRIVLNAYFGLAGSGGGFRTWWRRLLGNDDKLDDTHLMRFSGRFSRRIHKHAQEKGIPLIHCERGQRKHELAEDLLPTDPDFKGVFCILVGRAPAPIRKVRRCSNGQPHIETVKPYPYVNQYSFHIIDPQWGHITIKLCPHPPFGAQIMLNGHEYVARQAASKGIGFTKQSNCFTEVSDAAALASVADAMSAPGAVGCLTKVCERWIYSACLCFALTTEDRDRSGFHYSYSVYQGEYSRNFLFRRGRQMDQVFEALIDRTRATLDIRTVRTVLGRKKRPSKSRMANERFEVLVERPVWNLTVFKVHFGPITLKIYSKGERVLRIECIVHNTKGLGCGKIIDRFPQIISALRAMLERFIGVLHCVDASFIDAGVWEQLPLPTQVGAARVPGVDVNNPRMRAVMAAAIILSSKPKGFAASELAAQVASILQSSQIPYGPRQAAYDLKKLRGKDFVEKIGNTRRYQSTSHGLRGMTALHVLREKVLLPLLAGAQAPKRGRKPNNWTAIDQHYESLRIQMKQLFNDIGLHTDLAA